MSVWSFSGAGSRSASSAERSTTRPTIASLANAQRRMPSPQNLDQAGQLPHRANHQFSVACVEMDTVVADQHGLSDLSRASGQDEIERQPRLACARRATDQHRPISHQHRGRVDAGSPGAGHGAGSLTTKRAPATVGSPSSPAGPVRFSAQTRPPCASMICFEIDSPNPEFCPKP